MRFSFKVNVVRKHVREEKLSKYFNKTHLSCAVTQVASRRGSEVLTVIRTNG